MYETLAGLATTFKQSISLLAEARESASRGIASFSQRPRRSISLEAAVDWRSVRPRLLSTI
jgi:hypothetical protein